MIRYVSGACCKSPSIFQRDEILGHVMVVSDDEAPKHAAIMRVNKHFHSTGTNLVKSKFVFTLVSFYGLQILAGSLQRYAGLGGTLRQYGARGTLTAAEYALRVVVKNPGDGNNAADQTVPVHIMLRSLTQLSILCRELVLGRGYLASHYRLTRLELHLDAVNMHRPFLEESLLSVLRDNLWSLPHLTLTGATDENLARKVVDTISWTVPSCLDTYLGRHEQCFSAMQRAINDNATVVALFLHFFDYITYARFRTPWEEWLSDDASWQREADQLYKMCQPVVSLLLVHALIDTIHDDTAVEKRLAARFAADVVVQYEESLPRSKVIVQERVRNRNRLAITEISIGELEDAIRTLDGTLHLCPGDTFARRTREEIAPRINWGLREWEFHEMAHSMYCQYREEMHYEDLVESF